MKKILFTIIMIALLSPAVAQRAKEKADQRFAGLDAQLNALLADWHAAGFAVAIIEKDKIVYSKGFGYRDYEKKIPVTSNTLFAIGSCTKAFTSSLVGMLDDEKRVDIDKSPIDYVPELRFYNDNMNNLITIRDLMCHRTGLPRHDASWYYFPTESGDTLIRRIRYQEPSARIRERFQYNNFMFMLQGLIVERVTGKSWADNVREKIFVPLNMTRSNFSIADLEKDGDGSLGYIVKNDTQIEKTPYYQIKGLGPAGNINSSVNEMANWVSVWINGGKFAGRQIIPASYIAEAISPQMIAAAGLPSKEHPDVHMNTYGFAWAVSSYRGHYRVLHGGNIDGFSALTGFYPSDSIGFVILTNQNGSVLPNVVRNIISDRMLGLKAIDWNKEMLADREKAVAAQKDAQAKSQSVRKSGTRPSHAVSDYTGSYMHPGYGTFRVVQSNDSLFAVMPLRKLYLRHFHFDVFEPFEIGSNGVDTTRSGGARLNFRTSEPGEIESVLFLAEPALAPIEFRRQDEIIEVSGESLRRYEGEFELGGMIARVYVKNDNVLYLFVPGQPEYELQPTGPNIFRLKELEGFRVEFVETGDKTIRSVIFIQPNGRFEAMKK
ncbi:MAG: serine hydrolase [Bacteroidetes bacterium]|nr:serine hydrolase [Bacteroidota bacterium]